MRTLHEEVGDKIVWVLDELLLRGRGDDSREIDKSRRNDEQQCAPHQFQKRVPTFEEDADAEKFVDSPFLWRLEFMWGHALILATQSAYERNL